jgi:hypothetical protein
MCAPLIWSFKRLGASSPPSASRTMAVSTALKKKTSFFGYHTFRTNGLVFGLCLRRRAIAIDSAGNNCHCQDDGRRDNGRRRALDFEKGHHKTPLPLISSSPQSTLLLQSTRKLITSRSDTGIGQTAMARLLPLGSLALA